MLSSDHTSRQDVHMVSKSSYFRRTVYSQRSSAGAAGYPHKRPAVRNRGLLFDVFWVEQYTSGYLSMVLQFGDNRVDHD